MAQQDGNSEEQANGNRLGGDPTSNGGPTTPSSSPDTSSKRQSTVGHAPNSVVNTSPTSARVNDTGLKKPSDQSELVGDPKIPLEDFDWADLEKRYHERMQECGKAEQEICDEFGQWVFDAWASITIVEENERSSKRLKTRMSYVLGAEERLEKKRLHYSSVVKAFESALALLSQS